VGVGCGRGGGCSGAVSVNVVAVIVAGLCFNIALVSSMCCVLCVCGGYTGDKNKNKMPGQRGERPPES